MEATGTGGASPIGELIISECELAPQAAMQADIGSALRIERPEPIKHTGSHPSAIAFAAPAACPLSSGTAMLSHKSARRSGPTT